MIEIIKLEYSVASFMKKKRRIIHFVIIVQTRITQGKHHVALSNFIPILQVKAYDKKYSHSFIAKEIIDISAFCFIDQNE